MRQVPSWKVNSLSADQWILGRYIAVFYVHVTVHRNKFLCNKTNYMHQFHKFILSWNYTCFRRFVCPSSGVFSVYTQQWYMSYRFVDSFLAGPGLVFVILYIWLSGMQEHMLLHTRQSAIQNNKYQSWSCSKAVYKPVWHIPLLSVHWKTPDDGQTKRPKHV